MNTSVLSDEKFIQLMKMNLGVWKEEGKEFSGIRVAWDWIKYNVRLFFFDAILERASKN